MPILQVALDFMILERALKAAKEAVEGGTDWLEAGTPLIKSAGMEAVRRLAGLGRPVVADLKIMDVGRVEVEMAMKSGAHVATVLALADDETIRDAADAAHKYGGKIMVDLINHPEPEKRAQEVELLGADYVCVHVGVDQQMHGENPLNTLKRVAKAVSIPVAAAGGINSETAGEVVKSGAEIVIVGGAIIKAPDIAEATKAIKKAMRGVKLSTELYRKYGATELRDAFEKVSTPNLSDAMHRKNAIGNLKKIGGGKMVGRAFTVRTLNGDWAKPVEAIEAANEGDVIVIDAGDGTTAVWGELATWSCKMKGIAGVVIFGAVRDADEIKKVGVPVYARHVVPNAGEPKGFGEMGVELQIGAVRIRPGDWVVGDESGIAVIPRERAVEIANRAIDVMEHENRVREEIKRGSTLSAVMELGEWEVKR
ncbi:MAG: bifunctional hexulose-6-phosphate synthase/ribonuclease regulator [Euryarchaeota archaeon]|nr:bifunctional hexulose-6-phosphate synthase/ribonuclease regulator [Euryarchaeota archaeon]